MSSVIVLSSSPPRVFARSPTQYNSSPSRSQSGDTSSPSSKRPLFKTLKSDRDGCSPTFTSAREVLKLKPGAENSPTSSPGKNKFKPNSSVISSRQPSSTAPRATFRSQDEVEKHKPRVIENYKSVYEIDSIEDGIEHMTVQILPSDVRRKKKNVVSAKKASTKPVPRRRDWTPPPDVDFFGRGGDSHDKRASFTEGFLANFAYSTKDQTESRIDEHTEPTSNNAATARKQIYPQPKAKVLPEEVLPKSSLQLRTSGKIVKKRNKSPGKKALTITGLATANYNSHELGSDNPIMQHLISTQAQAQGCGFDESTLQTRVLKTKSKSRSQSAKSQFKSRLVSPQSALKTFGDQDVIFASASQLLRDESPTFLRDTVTAMKQSEGIISSDPIPSQQTDPISTDPETPQKGLSFLKGRRDLWKAADRDEDNALLYDDCQQMLPSGPTDKHAINSNADVTKMAPSKCSETHIKQRPADTPSRSYIVDINTISPGQDQVETCFAGIQRRAVHMSAKDLRTTTAESSKLNKHKLQPAKSAENDKNPASEFQSRPPKPNYAGFTDDELKKQLSAYGFKRMRKRERMIATLEKCWTEKYGVDKETEQTPNVDILRHGDFLSKVHDIASRPQPKGKKSRSKTPKPGDPESEKKQPKKRKSDPVDVEAPGKSAEKRKRQRKRIKNAEDEQVLDVDELDNSNYLEKATANHSAPFPAPHLELPSQPLCSSSPPSENKTGVQAVLRRPLTPPATMPVVHLLSSSPGFDDISAPIPISTGQGALPTPDDSFASARELPDIKTQILKALKCPKRPPNRDKGHQIRNHQTDPTWHEKILMYDPIVLEDFTAWLNTEGLNAIAEDREIDIMEVRAWCEENGICCLWKGGWRGRGLKGTTDGAFD